VRIEPSTDSSGEVDRVDRQVGGRPGTGTNYAFDTGQLTESHLSDPEIVARLNALSKDGLRDYLRMVADPAVRAYIEQLIASRPAETCTADQAARTGRLAEQARTDSLPFLASARVALDRLHGRWIDNKPDLLSGARRLEGEVAWAFNSNFNITPTDPDYGVRQIWVMSRLRSLESRMSAATPAACETGDDPVCGGTNQDTVAYVRGGRPPIHYCPQFRDDPDAMSRQANVVHEYAHLLPGVHDQGGYALGGFGAQVTTCSTGVKFRAGSDVLTNTADALAGFVMHIGQRGADDLRVR